MYNLVVSARIKRSRYVVKGVLGPDIFLFGVCCVEVTQQNVSCTDVASRRDLREDVCAIVYTYG